MAEKKKDKLQSIIKDFSSKDEKVVLAALKAVKKHGEKEAVAPLIQLLNDTSFGKVKAEVIEIFSQLQLESAQDELIYQIKENKFPELRPTLLSTIWNSGKHPRKHLATLVEFATLGDPLTTIEVYTIIDNMEPPIRDEWLMDAQVVINKYLTGGNAKNAVDELFKNIVNKIREWEDLEN